MNCREFETEWAGLEDLSRLSPEMETHRQRCRSCADMLEDIGYIMAQARRLRLEDDPPERVWHGIRRQLEQEGLVRRPQPAAPRWFPAAGWFARLPMGLAYASVFFVAVGVMYLQSLLQNPAAPPMLATTPSVPELAITDDSPQEVEVMARRIPLEHRATFVSNWNQVNSSIRQLSDFLETHPGDPFARLQLMTAFQQREHLRETFVRWEVTGEEF